MSNRVRTIIFLMFLISGFCGLLYQVVWIRIAYANFGIIMPVMSVVISVFMLGLLIGSAAGGPIIKKLVRRSGLSAIIFYALIELLIGLNALCVPKIFLLEQHGLLSLGSMNSFGYLFVSGLFIAVALLPGCILMGFTYPFMMTFVRETDKTATSSFSFLYLANVIGAMAGTIVTAVVFIELFGLIHTLAITAVCNLAIAAVGFTIGRKQHVTAVEEINTQGEATVGPAKSGGKNRSAILLLLFINGFAAMCMEIIWTRNFTTVLRTVIYSYASLLATYLFASWVGSYLYRKHLSRSRCVSVEALVGCVAIFSLLPLVLNDPRFALKGAALVLLSIMPLCGALGYLTPKLVDDYSNGSPSKAGWAYAVNTLGCILGPLFASYLFLPVWGVKVSLLLLSVTLAACFIAYAHRLFALLRGWTITAAALLIAMVSVALFYSGTYEEYFNKHFRSLMWRDYAATVTSVGNTRADKFLYVNGIGITLLSPITQFMAHLPLAYCEKKPTSALDICFGMGTTFRSLVSWGIAVTAVELVPSIPKAFGYFWSDADSVMGNPLAEVIIDDGRRYLMRAEKKFDVITIDPPPPVEAAGSSLLYSVEMYELIKKRLKPGGVLQQWIPRGEVTIIQAATRSVAATFPYVKVYHSIEGWGYHVLASMRPLRQATAADLFSRMPEGARKDLLTWCDSDNVEEYVQRLLSKEIPLDSVLSQNKKLIITDAKPYNEYFLLRRLSRIGIKNAFIRALKKVFKQKQLASAVLYRRAAKINSRFSG